jgi:hypothetical protein
MNRYDLFLSRFLSKYIENPLIDEIIITDETGEDAMKIWSSEFASSPKLQVFINDKRLGVFQNKQKALSCAKNEWIALIDSDNFADEDYFEEAKKYILSQKPSVISIISPSEARPGFNSSDFQEHAGFSFPEFAGKIIDRRLLRSTNEILLRTSNITLLMNTGNFIINKFLVDNLRLNNEDSILISKNFWFDVIYHVTLLFEQLDLNFHVCPNMYYRHSVHDESLYITTCTENTEESKVIYERFYSLAKTNTR